MKNPEYEKVRKMIEVGILTDFEQIAWHVGKHKLCAAVGMAFETLALRIADPGKYKVHELAALSDLFGLDHKVLLEMADRLRKKKGKK